MSPLSSFFELEKPFNRLNEVLEPLGGAWVCQSVLLSEGNKDWVISGMGTLCAQVSFKNGVNLLLFHDQESETFGVSPVRAADEFNVLKGCAVLPNRDPSRPECNPESHLCFKHELATVFGRYAEIPREVVERIHRDDERRFAENWRQNRAGQMERF
jgi:hypothetical protein